jgi:hypothetical protein
LKFAQVSDAFTGIPRNRALTVHVGRIMNFAAIWPHEGFEPPGGSALSSPTITKRD